MDPELPFFAVKPMQQRVDESLVSRRTPMMLASLFGGIALFLAAVGIYGVLAFQVAQRRKEIGIRMALGSDGRRIFGLIVTEGPLAARASASAIGLAGAFAIRRAMETQLFGVQPMDPLVLAAVTGDAGARRVPGVRRPGAPRGADRSADCVERSVRRLDATRRLQGTKSRSR